MFLLKSPPQVHIVQSTGRITYVQLLSMLFSLFTLSINASRAFYIQRGKEEADPAPSPHMILKVFPFMLIQVLYKFRRTDIAALICRF